MDTAADAPGDRLVLWEHPDYAFFWISRVASAMAFQIHAVAAGWQIYALTHSAFQLGMVGLMQFLPMVLLTLPAGHAADRYRRRTICLGALVIQACAIGALAVANGMHWINVPAIFASVMVVGAARAFERPANQALMPSLVPAALFPKAVAWATGGFQAASIVGPALGGVLYAWGETVPYAAAGVLAFVAGVFIAVIRRKQPRVQREPATLQSLFAGIVYIRQQPVVLGSISLDLFAVLLGGATALLPAFAHDLLHVGSWGLGALRSAPAVGSLVTSAYLLVRPMHRNVGKKMFAAVIGFGLATIVFGLSRSFTLSLVALLALGAFDVVSVVVRSSLVQLRTPDEMRGRVNAVNSLFIGTSNQLGEFESGLTAAWLGTSTATWVGGVGTILIAVLWMRLFPALANYDRFEPPEGQPTR